MRIAGWMSDGWSLSQARARRWLAGLFAVAMLVGGCDDEPVEDDADSGRDLPEVVEGCADDQDEGALVQVGETRTCTCDDGVDSSQMCLSSGAFGLCECDGGGW